MVAPITTIQLQMGRGICLEMLKKAGWISHHMVGRTIPSQTQTAPAKPPKQPKPIDSQVKPSPKPPKQPQSGHSNNVGSTQNGTVTLPNGTTVYKGIKTPQDLR